MGDKKGIASHATVIIIEFLMLQILNAFVMLNIQMMELTIHNVSLAIRPGFFQTIN